MRPLSPDLACWPPEAPALPWRVYVRAWTHRSLQTLLHSPRRSTAVCAFVSNCGWRGGLLWEWVSGRLPRAAEMMPYKPADLECLPAGSPLVPNGGA